MLCLLCSFVLWTLIISDSVYERPALIFTLKKTVIERSLIKLSRPLIYHVLWHCRYGVRPRSRGSPLSSYGDKLTMATIAQVKDVLKKEPEPLNSKLETMTTKFSELKNSVQLFSDKYNDLLKQIKQSNEKLHQH